MNFNDTQYRRYFILHNRTVLFVVSFSPAILPNMSKLYWRCDPNTPIEGGTFVQLTKLLQVWNEFEFRLKFDHKFISTIF